jgi:hypothetical protein
MTRLRKVLAALAVTATAMAANVTLQTSPAVAGSVPTGKTVSIAATKFDPGRDFIVAQSDDTRLYYNVWGEPNWTEIPGVRSRVRPAVTVYNNRIHVTVTGLDGRVYVGQMNKITRAWTPFYEIPGGMVLGNGPATLSGSDGSFTVFGTGADARVYYHQYEDNTWSPYGWQVVPGVATYNQVSVVEFQKKVMLAHSGTDDRVWMAESAVLLYDTPGQAGGWWGSSSNAYKVPGHALTYASPAVTLGANSAILHVLMTGTSFGKDTYYTTYRNGAWKPAWKRVEGDLGNQTSFPIAVNGTGFNGYAIQNNDIRTQYLPDHNNELDHYGDSLPVPSPQPVAKPDLTWTSGPKYNPQTQRVEIPLKNASSVNAGPFRVSYQVNNGTVVEIPFSNGLAAGASTIVWISPSLPAGSTYNFVADIYDTVRESNESNNGWNGIF